MNYKFNCLKTKFNIFLRILIAITIMTIIYCIPIFAAKYTITNGIDFNARIKMAINSTYTSATEEKTISAFKFTDKMPSDQGKLIDISEDGDSSVLAYIDAGTIYYISEEDVSLNADASYMFDKFINLKNVDLSYLNFSKVRKTNYMFSNCRFLTNVDFDNDTILKLDEMEGMFYDCQSLVDLDIFMLDTRNVKNMNSLFFNCKNIKNIIISNDCWNIKKVNSFVNTFNNCFMLKTNFGKRAVDISQNDYKKYAIAGDDDVEGLLKDVDYEYDDYGKNDGSYAVDNIGISSITADNSINVSTNMSSMFLQNVKSLSEVNIATDSSLIEVFSDVSIKNGKKTFSDRLLSQTVEELPTVDGGVPILLDETTHVDVLIPKKKKNASTISELESKIVPPEGGILRPVYDGNGYLSENEIADETIKENEKETNFKENKIKNDNNSINIPTIAFVIAGAIILILAGVVLSNIKQKHDNDNL